jgi:hypothetical protein
MSSYVVSDDDFIRTWNESLNATEVARKLGLNIRTVFHRRRSVEFKYNIELKGFPIGPPTDQVKKIHQTQGHVRRGIDIEKGRVLVFSDAHFQPGEVTTAYKALLLMIKVFKHELKAIVANGDMFDGAQASRHPRIQWSKTPTVKEELEACQEYMGGIEDAASKNTELIWTLGNHDARFETFLSNSGGLSTYEGVQGFSLKDHFPMWKNCWSYWINEDTCIKHKLKGGFGATRSNALTSGINYVTGHTHNLSTFPITDLSPAFNMGTRWGVQTGTLADIHSEAFVHYTEDAPVDWRSGFVLLSWENGRMLMPEMIMVSGEDEFEFRGCINKV